MLLGISLWVNIPFGMLISTWSLHEQTGVHGLHLKNGTKYLWIEGEESGKRKKEEKATE